MLEARSKKAVAYVTGGGIGRGADDPLETSLAGTAGSGAGEDDGETGIR